MKIPKIVKILQSNNNEEMLRERFIKKERKQLIKISFALIRTYVQ